MYKDVHLTVVTDKDVLQSLMAASYKRMEDRERMQAILGDLRQEVLKDARVPFYGAPAVIFVSHRIVDVQPGIEFANVATIVYSMHLAATDQGLGSVFIWGILEAMREIPELDATGLLHLPENFVPLMGLALGYAAQNAPERKISLGRIGTSRIGAEAPQNE